MSQGLTDDQQIREVVVRYCRGVDRADWDLVRSCYHDDSFEDHLGWQGSADEFVEFGRASQQRYVSMSHCVMNQWIQWHEDGTAVSETYALAMHRTDEPNARDEAMLVRYLDRFEKRSSGWRIARRKVIADWSRVDPVGQLYPFRPGSEMGTRDDSDASFELFEGSHPQI